MQACGPWHVLDSGSVAIAGQWVSRREGCEAGLGMQTALGCRGENRQKQTAEAASLGGRLAGDSQRVAALVFSRGRWDALARGDAEGGSLARTVSRAVWTS